MSTVRINRGHGVVVEVEDRGDVDLDREDVRLDDGMRLTERKAREIAREARKRVADRIRIS